MPVKNFKEMYNELFEKHKSKIDKKSKQIKELHEENIILKKEVEKLKKLLKDKNGNHD